MQSVLKFIWKIVNYFVPTLVFLLILEIFVRIVHPPPYPMSLNKYMYEENQFSNFTLSKNYRGTLSNWEYANKVYTNDLGFRDSHNNSAYINANKKKILLVGDSMTFGQGVEYQETFSSLLAHNTNYQIFNGGVPSFGTMNELGMLKDKGHQINPNIVILFFYPGNDFYDNTRGFIKHVIGGYLTDDKDLDPKTIKTDGLIDTPIYTERKYFNIFDKGLVHISALYRYLRYRSTAIPSLKQAFTKHKIINFTSCALPFSTAPYFKGYEKEIEYQNTINILKEVKKVVVHDLKAKFILVHLPIRESVNSSLLQYEFKNNCIKNPKLFDVEYPDKLLNNFAKSEHIMYIDATDNLKSILKRNKNPFFAIDSHMNKEGHEAVYELLRSILK